VILPTSVFLWNEKGDPVLSAAHQKVVERLWRRREGMQWIITDDSEPEGGEVAASGIAAAASNASSAITQKKLDLRAYQLDLRHLFLPHAHSICRRRLHLGCVRRAAYRDVLQSPLQPRADNLESGV
jgi:hypothetical protein